jgi:hypothetical protein
MPTKVHCTGFLDRAPPVSLERIRLSLNPPHTLSVSVLRVDKFGDRLVGADDPVRGLDDGEGGSS